MLPWSVTPPPENDHVPSGRLEAADELGGGAGGRFPSFHFPARRAPHNLTPSFLFHKQRWEHSSQRQFANNRGKYVLFSFKNCFCFLKTISKKSIGINEFIA